MPTLDDLELVRRALEVPGPRADVIAAGRDRLDALAAGQARALAARPVARKRRLRVRAALACGAAAAVAVAVAATLVVAHPHSETGGTGEAVASARPRQPAPTGSVQQAILTAAGSVSGDIMQITETTSGEPDGVGDGVIRYLSWPARPASGQRVRVLSLRGALRVEETYAQPSQSASTVMTMGTALVINTSAKTWSRALDRLTPNTPEMISLFLLDKRTILKFQVLNAHATLDGRAVIELSVPAVGQLRVLAWVDARTYLPMRMVKLHWTNNPASRKQYDFAFLPPTPASRAALTAAVPPGYRHTPG
jgi:hypothetical protein